MESTLLLNIFFELFKPDLYKNSSHLNTAGTREFRTHLLGALCFFIQQSEHTCFGKNLPFIGILQAPNLEGMKTKLTSTTLF